MIPLAELDQAGRRVDAFWAANALSMTMGAEPTYLCEESSDKPEWTLEAVGPQKLELARRLSQRLHQQFGASGILQHGQGKWYPGEESPRWALRSIWPLSPQGPQAQNPQEVLIHLCQSLGLDPAHARPCRDSQAWILVLDFSSEHGWRTCAWPQSEITLVDTPGPVGMRLPWSEVELELGTALCVDMGHEGLEVFLPPVACTSAWLQLVRALPSQVRFTGYSPPIPNLADEGEAGLRLLSVTPDPGVIEINLHPASNWPELVDIVTRVDVEARACGLVSHRFDRDGRLLGSGGGCHLVVGGPSPAKSPFVERPDLLRSILIWWNHHPALSYLFSGLFVGPHSQAPRVDEARHESLYELELAFRELDCEKALHPEILGRIFRDLLVDVSGNGHRSEICVDKLFDPLAPGGQQGLLEFRAMEMAPRVDMNLALMLLLRALLGRLWKDPVSGPLHRFGTELHDRYMLPTFLWADLGEVLDDLSAHGLSLESRWYRPHLEFRFPLLGRCRCAGVTLELRSALEPWPVIGDDASKQGTSRPVDSSLQRVEVRLSGLDPTRHRVACNGHFLPLHRLAPGEWVSAVRFRAWQFQHSLHPTVGIQSPLQFDLLEGQQIIGSCRYHTMHPEGRPWNDFPRGAEEAERRRNCRFETFPGPNRETLTAYRELPPHPEFPLTLDLRLADLNPTP